MKISYNRRSLCAILALLMALLFTQPVLAMSTSDAKEPIDAGRTDCELSVSYQYKDGTSDVKFSGQNVKLYQIASVDKYLEYTPTDAFSSSGIDLTKISSQEQWDTMLTTLLSFITSRGVSPSKETATDAAGTARFRDLKPGIYLVSGMKVSQGRDEYTFQNTLAAVPGVQEDGTWQYQVAVNPKCEKVTHPAENTSQKKSYHVTKLWKGDEGTSLRPEHVRVEIYLEDELYKTVLLSAENNWTYKWRSSEDDWAVAEERVPEGYHMTVSQDGRNFYITNTATDTRAQVKTPKTGDSGNPELWIGLICFSGLGLMLAGVWLLQRGKR